MKLNEDQTRLISLLSEGAEQGGIQISSFILNQMKSFEFSPYSATPERRATDLKTYIKTITFLEQLGWIEHTGDWDPYLIIILNDGTVIESESGYYLMEISKDNNIVSIENCDEDGDEAEPIRIQIMDIKTIQIWA